MSETVLVALISLFGTFGGSVMVNRLTIYRIDQLEKKVEKHNNVIERTYLLETKMELTNDRIKNLEERK